MNTSFSSISYIDRQWNDVVFDKRNKEYGAYYIRTHYNENVGIAFIITGSIFIAIFVSIFIYLNTLGNSALTKDGPVVNVLPKVPPTVMVDPPKGGVKPPLQSTRSKAAPLVGSDTSYTEPKDTTLPAQTIQSTGLATSLTASIASAGEKTGGSTELQGTITTFTIDTTVRKFAEVMPEFPGGETALDNYILKHINIPRQWRDDGPEGKIYFGFVVGADGNVRDVRILSDRVGYGCGESNTGLFSNMPHWKPGMQNGYPVNVMMQVPLIFRKE